MNRARGGIWPGGIAIVAMVVVGLLSGWVFRPDATPEMPVQAGNDQSAEGDNVRHKTTTGGAAANPADSSPAPQEKNRAPENHLANETSPYLQSHKNNPVDWYPWGAEALERAKKEDKLIFLSIGYSSCHWCHVMERESFNDPEIAGVLNKSFVCIKVDREELPDVDEIFMTFVQLSNRGGGGWPLTVFLTPDARPIAGATYFPPRSARGMPGLLETLGVVLDRWQENRAELEDQAEAWTRTLQSINSQRGFSFRQLDGKLVAEAIEEISTEYDSQYGGFGFDPRNPQRAKFPQPSTLRLLAYRAGQAKDAVAAEMLNRTLHRMAQGGIWDCVGGGFHRYSVDRFWRVPHFEKMLYDNAQLARLYTESFAITNDRVFRHIARRIFQFIESEMTSPEGGFYSALDADSEHEEGKYYVWSKDEVRQVLDPQEYAVVANVQMTGEPNLPDGRYVLQLDDSLPAIAARTGIHEGNLAGALERAATKLLAVRNQRIRPMLDTKVLTDWNGLMIAALADAHRILGDPAYRTAAERAADLILTKLRREDGRLLHVYSAGEAKIPGYLDDYAFLLDGLVALHEATGDDKWLTAARSLADRLHELFWDESGGGYFQVAHDTAPVLTRLKSSEDSSVPSGNSVATLAMVRLARKTGEPVYAQRAAQTLAAFAGSLGRAPGRWPGMARALAEYLDAGFSIEALAVRSAGEPQVLFAQAIMPQDKLPAGSPFTFHVVFEIDRSWHIYANQPATPELVPTTLDVTSELELSDLSIVYPSPKTYQPEGAQESVAVYSEQGRIRVTGVIGPDAKVGRAEIQLALRYQACNDERCLAPKTFRLNLPIEVTAAKDSTDGTDP